jgi:hypothetical protein
MKELEHLSKKELILICKEKNIKKYSSKNKTELVELIRTHLRKQDIALIGDTYTKDVFLEFYSLHKNYVKHRITIGIRLDIKFRLPSIPEDISENIIKFIIHELGDKTSKWNCKTGDLFSIKEGKQECKTFTSKGPISFSPTISYNVIYFLDARLWLKDIFILYKINITQHLDRWKNISVNKKQTFYDQCQQGRRPRISWDSLYKQTSDICEKIYEGDLEKIISL